MIKTTASHLDHGLNSAQVEHIMTTFADRSAFFIETITLPEELGTVPCGLYGPTMGDEPVDRGAGSGVILRRRGDRQYVSRCILRKPRPVREVTVIAGPHEEKCKACDGRGAWTGIFPSPPFGEQCGACGAVGVIKHSCVLYTAFGGPLTPKETGDPTLDPTNEKESRKFWSQHALASDYAPITYAEIEELEQEAKRSDDGALESTCWLALAYVRGRDGATLEESEEYKFELAEKLIARRALAAQL